ncbi:MAG: hypothetical protein HY099_03410 [Nitrospirae bacterium]|nr:hypothetical protein [Nitrospirota bacterium]
MQNYKKIAVVAFNCPDASAGQKTADRFVLKFGRRGYNVIERSKLKKLVNEDALVNSGLTEADKSALEHNGINALVLGSITRYDCQTKKEWIWTGFSPEQITKNLCHAALSLKMVAVSSGEVIWEAYDSHSEYDEGMTARTVLEIVISRLEEKIPLIKQ